MARLKLRKIKKKRHYKIIYLIIIIYLVFAYTFYYSFKSISRDTNEIFIKFLLNNGSGHFTDNYKVPVFLNKTLGYLLKIDITKPVTLFNENIIGYSFREESVSDKEIEALKQVSYYMQDPNKMEITNPIVYIYNSHQLENYDNTNLAIYGITPNVLMASYLLKEKLNNLGIPSVVEDTNLTEFLELNNWSYNNSYKASRIFILDKMNTYPTLKYFIDIHRDSVGKDVTTVSINNKKYAKILFVIGLEQDNYLKNLSIVEKLNKLFCEYYPGISRGIYKKSGPNVNGIYNQDISPNVMLIEVGGIDNNIDEVVNTINAISDVLSRYIKNEK